MIWDTLTSVQLAKVDRNIPVLMPLAATEQHGPHLPVATDRLIGEHFIRVLNEQMSGSFIALPTVAVGCSDHHMGYSGTLSLRHATFLAVVKDIVTSVLQHGFYKIILINSHGGNQAIGQVILEALGYEYPEGHFAILSWWGLAAKSLMGITETERGGTGHACEFETSLVQLIAPDLVQSDLIAKGTNVPTFSWAEGDMLNGAQASYYRSMRTMTSNGVYGDPSAATPEKGQKITDCVVASLKQVVADLNGIKNK